MKKNYIGTTPADYSDKDLLLYRDKMRDLYEEIVDGWAKELAQTCDKDFDEYSFSGKRKINKLTKKWSEKLSSVQVALEMVQEELVKRNYYDDKQSYFIDGDYKSSTNLSDDEFLRIEQEKTEMLKSILSDDEN